MLVMLPFLSGCTEEGEPSPPPGTYENFADGTWTESDDYSSIEATSNVITVTSLPANCDETWYQKNIGSVTTFSHAITFTMTNHFESDANAYVWLLTSDQTSNSYNDAYVNNREGLGIYILRRSAQGDIRLTLRDHSGGSEDYDSMEITEGTTYTLTIEGDGSTVDVDVKSGGVTVGTLTVPDLNPEARSWLCVVAGRDLGGTGTISYTVENLDLNA